MLILWRYGGTYLDLDIVTLRSLADLPPNYIGRDIGGINNAVLNSDAHGIGHQIMEKCLAEFQAHFNGHIWSFNGPKLIRRVILKHCNITEKELSEHGCQGFKLYSAKAFYPVYWRNWLEYFDPSKMTATLAKTKNSYLVHIWNKVSKAEKAMKSDKPNSAYAYFVKENCPRVYGSVEGQYF